MNFVITFTEEQINAVVTALKKQPMEQVETIVVSIIQQANQQLADAQKTETAPPVEDTKTSKK